MFDSLVTTITEQINNNLVEIRRLNDNIIESPAHRRMYKIQREKHYANIGRLYIELTKLNAE